MASAPSPRPVKPRRMTEKYLLNSDFVKYMTEEYGITVLFLCTTEKWLDSCEDAYCDQFFKNSKGYLLFVGNVRSIISYCSHSFSNFQNTNQPGTNSINQRI